MEVLLGAQAHLTRAQVVEALVADDDQHVGREAPLRKEGTTLPRRHETLHDDVLGHGRIGHIRRGKTDEARPVLPEQAVKGRKVQHFA